MIGREKEQYEPIGRQKTSLDLNKLTEEELLALRHAVDSRLPVTKLADMNLEQELTLQFRMAQVLQSNVLNDSDVPANQKAQVMNSVASTIQSLVRMQVEYYTPERLKKIEAMLVRCLNSLPEEQVEAFFVRYEEFLKGGG